MCCRLRLGETARQGDIALAGRAHPLAAGPPRRRAAGSAGGQAERGLLAANQFDIDFRQKFGVEQGTVAGALAVVDAIARTEGIQAVRPGGVATTGELERIHDKLGLDRRQ